MIEPCPHSVSPCSVPGSASCSASSSDEECFTADYFSVSDVRPIPISQEENSFSAAADHSEVTNIGEGAREFFDEVSGDTSSLSASEECSQESSDVKFFNITFSLPGKDFRFYFPGSNGTNLCNKISAITIPKGIKHIEDYSFNNFSLLTNITIPNSVIEIGSNAFLDCSLLTNITIPNSVKKIGSYAFSGCTSLISISIPRSVIKIGINVLPDSVFLFKKTNLRSIQISNVIGSFNRKIVFGKKYLCSIEVPHSLKFVNNSKFVFNDFNNFIIPNTTEFITNYAFYNCSSLISISIFYSVKKIGDYAFMNCDSLPKSFSIPISVQKVGKDIFLKNNSAFINGYYETY